MNTRIAKLEGLLSRIHSRAQAPRSLVTDAASSNLHALVPPPEVDFDEPTLESQPSAQSQAFLAPVLDAPELDVPELDAPDLDTSILDEPELDSPSLDEPELDPPSLDEPGLDAADQGPPDSASIEMGAPESMDIDELDELDELDDLDAVEVDDHLPESGPVSANIDDAMAAAEYQPPLTPPPESGEGLATPHIPPRGGPTMEQLGQTISLEEGRSQKFDLDEPIQDELSPANGHFEMEIPGSVPRGSEMMAPPEAREELERHRLGDVTPIEARVSTRPMLSTNVVDLVSASKSFEPKSFLDLLDASLELK